MTEPCHTVEPLLSAWLDDALEPRERRRVADHLAVCTDCSKDADALAATRTLLRSMPVRRVPDDWPPSVGASGLEPGADAAASRVPRALVAVIVAGAVGVGALAFGTGQPEPDRRVAVPVDVFVADHLARTVETGVTTPVLLESP